MRTEVLTRLGETAGFYTSANIDQWLNDGVDDLVVRLEPVFADARIDVTAGTWEYLLPEDLVSIKTVLTKDTLGTWTNMTPTTLEELFRDNAAWESTTSGPPATHWYWKENTLGIYPVPTTTISSGIRLIFTCRPREMTADAHTTGLSSYMDRLAVLYAVMRAREKDRDQQRAVAARAEWEAQINMTATILNKHRKEHAPRLQPDPWTYRTYYYGRHRRLRAWSA
jgi:hypothetical protein